jgi:hypothetical protein
MSDDKGVVDDKGTVEGGSDEPFLGSWKTKEDAAEGLSNLQTKLSEQGNETGSLRKQIEESQSLMGEMQEKLSAAEASAKSMASDRDAKGVLSEQDMIAKQIAGLDPVDEGYSKNLMSLLGKSNSLAAKGQHAQTLQEATKAFKQELDARDVKSAHQAFYDANPDFDTPEMQGRVKDYISKDKTGMSDSLSAYREIQRDDAMANALELTKQNEELMGRLDLKKGTDETGKVILKSQSDQNVKPQTNLKGADRDKAMMDALNGLKS